MQEARRRALCALPGTLIVLSGCASNIGHIEAASGARAPKSRAFDVGFERTWAMAQRTLAEDETFKVLDKSSRRIRPANSS